MCESTNPLAYLFIIVFISSTYLQSTYLHALYLIYFIVIYFHCIHYIYLISSPPSPSPSLAHHHTQFEITIIFISISFAYLLYCILFIASHRFNLTCIFIFLALYLFRISVDCILFISLFRSNYHKYKITKIFTFHI